MAEVNMSSVANRHIHLDDRGVAWIDDTNVKVIEVALDHLAQGLSPTEIQYQHYDHLTLAQIHAALAWYYDHQDQFDTEIAAQVARYEQQRSASLNSPARQRIKRNESK
jgi:uncharacterized protein (DUF433 family)